MMLQKKYLKSFNLLKIKIYKIKIKKQLDKMLMKHYYQNKIMYKMLIYIKLRINMLMLKF